MVNLHHIHGYIFYVVLTSHYTNQLKPEKFLYEYKIDYIAMPIGNEFIVGYGIDYAEHYRNLPFIGILKREVYEK